MITEELEEKLDQAVTLIKKLLDSPTEQTKSISKAFVEDYDNPQPGYSYLTLTGDPDDLKF